MASSSAKTVSQYLESLPADRREAIRTVHEVILDHLPRGYEHGMQYGMIGYYVPLSRLANTYNGQPLGVAALASQKQYMSVYLSAVYSDPKLLRWFTSEYRKTGKKLDMGESCVRFKRLDDLPRDLIAQTISKVSVDAFIASYERVHGGRAKEPRNKNRVRRPVAAKRSGRAAR